MNYAAKLASENLALTSAVLDHRFVLRERRCRPLAAAVLKAAATQQQPQDVKVRISCERHDYSTHKGRLVNIEVSTQEGPVPLHLGVIDPDLFEAGDFSFSPRPGTDHLRMLSLSQDEPEVAISVLAAEMDKALPLRFEVSLLVSTVWAQE